MSTVRRMLCRLLGHRWASLEVPREMAEHPERYFAYLSKRRCSRCGSLA